MLPVDNGVLAVEDDFAGSRDIHLAKHALAVGSSSVSSLLVKRYDLIHDGYSGRTILKDDENIRFTMAAMFPW